jgi:hypothetical protein
MLHGVGRSCSLCSPRARVIFFRHFSSAHLFSLSSNVFQNLAMARFKFSATASTALLVLLLSSASLIAAQPPGEEEELSAADIPGCTPSPCTDFCVAEYRLCAAECERRDIATPDFE